MGFGEKVLFCLVCLVGVWVIRGFSFELFRLGIECL